MSAHIDRAFNKFVPIDLTLPHCVTMAFQRDVGRTDK
jgi:hypothetical protein